MTAEKEVPLGEAPSSVNFKGVTKSGWLCQWTLRDFDEIALLDRQGAFIQRLDEGGVVPYGKPAPIPEGKATPPQPTADAGPGGQPAMPPSTTSEEQEELMFEAEEMVHGSGKAWKVKGEKYAQFGVTVWPEVLKAAGFEPEAMDTDLSYSLQGYTAYCEGLTEKGYPKKVVNLAK